MARLSDKYIAGFLDADGYIQTRWVKSESTNLFRLYVQVKFTQIEKNRIVLDKIKTVYGGNIESRTLKGTEYLNLVLASRDAVPMLAKMGQYLVIKRNFTQYALSLHKNDFKYDDMVTIRSRLKTLKQSICLPIPVHPTRGWTAGYFDGDGCIDARLNKHANNSCSLRMRITAVDYYDEGVTLLYKAFGGTLTVQNKRKPHLVTWNLALPPSKLKEIYKFMGKHLLLKREQFAFAKGCADMGHFRDGKTIKQILSDLKAQPQRLSDSSCDISHLTCKVKDLQKMWWKQ